MGISARITNLTVRLRTELIRKGVGRKYFLSSQNPVVRATAFCSRVNPDTTMEQLAGAIMTDCLEGSRIFEPAAAVYRVHLSQALYDPGETNLLAGSLLKLAELKDDLSHSLLILDLLKNLGIQMTR